MEFEVVYGIPTFAARNRVYLIKVSWDDWFTYNTMYYLTYVDSQGTQNSIGNLKIGQLNQQKKRADITEEVAFNGLSDQFFSVGQEESYYKRLNELGENIRDLILIGLRDIAFDEEIFGIAKSENVLHSSLLRSVSVAAVKGKFRRLSHGLADPFDYKFTYKILQSKPIELVFEVTTESNPPTNIHAIIGRNGVGKTHLISNMINTILSQGENDFSDEELQEPHGIFYEEVDSFKDYEEMFANIVLVSFSAFDTSLLPKERDINSRGIRYSYIGLRQIDNKTGKDLPPKTPTQLADEFGDSAFNCCKKSKSRWTQAIETLETDPLFKAYSIAELTESEDDEDKFKRNAKLAFNSLSSGHKIVLLSLTRLVETVEERTLVLLDEPESHLHPPLLSAFTRALSDLLFHRNAVAITATHSPVILQEMPKTCVWILRSNLSRILATDRPAIETFGENIGSLTSEVFKLEVENSGFHKLLEKAVNEHESYDEIIAVFEGQLGHEAKAILRVMIATKE